MSKSRLTLPTISLCMIVRNEAENIVHCLDSVKDIVDEIIIVDTGSTDNTVEVCRRYTDKIHFFKWTDDFSEARNVSLKYATGDWILIMDGDEILDPFSSKALKKFIKAQPENMTVFDFLIYDVTREDILAKLKQKQKIDVYPYKVHLHVRLFRNHLGYKYKYSLHEILDMSETTSGMYRSGFIVFHYGYRSVDKNRLERAMICLNRDILKYPGDLFVKFNLARTYYLADQPEKTINLMDEVIEDYLKYPEKRGIILLAVIYKYYVNILFAQKSYEKALKVTLSWLSRLKENYDPRPYVALGKAYFMLDRDAEALQILELVEASLKKHLNFDYPEEIPYLEKDINYFLGCLYLAKGRAREAYERLKQVKDKFAVQNPNIDKLIVKAEAELAKQ